ncbi:hypothetical protein [Fusobacterium necrophorum]|nr:hypothetical protein [Fusobacterium necrophorum]
MPCMYFDDEINKYVIVENEKVIYETEDESNAFLVLDDLTEED